MADIARILPVPQMAIPSDTSPDALAVQIELLRKATLSERFCLMCDLTTTAIELSRGAIQRANPSWSELEVKLKWAELHYGKDLADQVGRHLGVLRVQRNELDEEYLTEWAKTLDLQELLTRARREAWGPEG